MAPISNTIRRDFKPKGGIRVMASNLHDVDRNCGIDSDAGISISTLREDFAWTDESVEAKESIESPAGINGGTSVIGGRGPMIVRATTGELLVDPDAVYLEWKRSTQLQSHGNTTVKDTWRKVRWLF